jgi:hypothetical protein
MDENSIFDDLYELGHGGDAPQAEPTGGSSSGDDMLGQRKRPQSKITPLTVWLELKQDPNSQSEAAAIVKSFKPGEILSPPGKTHFFRVISIPNNDGKGLAGIVIASIFDGQTYRPYLELLWGWTAKKFAFKEQWDQMCSIMAYPPANPTSKPLFMKYVMANKLNVQKDLSYGYTASAEEISKNENLLPMARLPQVNPLSLFVPFRQVGLSGLAGRNLLPIVKKGLSGNLIHYKTLIHFALVAIIPNRKTYKNKNGNHHQHSGFLLLTCFDNAMDPYLDFFWSQKSIQLLWKIVLKFATNIDPREAKKEGWDNPKSLKAKAKFHSYINKYDRSKVGDLSGSYTASLPDIFEQYPIYLPPKK